MSWLKRTLSIDSTPLIKDIVHIGTYDNVLEYLDDSGSHIFALIPELVSGYIWHSVVKFRFGPSPVMNWIFDIW